MMIRVAGRRHQHHAERGEQYQRVVFRAGQAISSA